MRSPFFSRAPVLLIAVSSLMGQSTIAPGDGAPNEYIRTLFTSAYYRGSFSRIAGNPNGSVRSFGTGLIQDFTDATRTSGKLALIKATALGDPESSAGGVYQVLTDVYAYYTSVGTATAGYPTQDTATCPIGGCQYQTFSNNVVLFVYPSGSGVAANFTLKDPFYSKWLSFGGLNTLGPATSAETAATSTVNAANKATVQTFSSGQLFNITAGPLNGRFLSIRKPVFGLYTTSLGFPLAEEMILPNGNHRQSFESGSIEYDPSGNAVLRPPVSSIGLVSKDTTIRLNLGDSTTVVVRAFAADGSELADRPVTFISSNSRVALVTSKGVEATVKAVGGGTATLTATAEGKTTPAVTIVVSAPCCQVGEGAPSAAVQQAFQDVITRTRLSVKLPSADRVRRVGNGYVQSFVAADSGTTRYLLALPDRSGQGFVVTGALLSRYEDLGGPAGPFGFPLSDANAGGRQLFENGVLAGTPVRTVAPPILSKWAALNYEAGLLGEPGAEATTLLSFAGTPGVSQPFRNGVIVSGTKGTFAVSGTSYSKYVSLNGPSGALGMPLGDEFIIAGVRHQDFEGGALDTSPALQEAKVTFKDRKPTVTATPAAVTPGTRIHLTVSGFSDGAILRVSVTGQPDFVVKTQTGSYAWDLSVPSNAPASAIKVRAVDSANPNSAAEATYTVRSLAELKAQITKLLGDTQTGAPGQLLPIALRVSVRDENGNPLTGTPVHFNASPGAQVTVVDTFSDSLGNAQTQLRLPGAEGITLVSVEAARQVTTFSARVLSGTLTNYPKLLAPPDSGGAGALLAAAASAVRYYQDRRELNAPNGLAEVESLGQYLKSFCATDTQAQQSCDGLISGSGLVNLWRLGTFAGGGVDVVPIGTDLASIREAATSGTPVLLALSVANGANDPVLHVVVATGINPDGSVAVHDPDASFGQTNLSSYLNGFGAWKGTVTGAAQVFARQPSPTGFVVRTAGTFSLRSPAGECGVTFELVGPLRFRVCDGEAAEYQLDISGPGTTRASVTDMAESGGSVEIAAGGGGSFRISRPGTMLSIVPQELVIGQRSVVNAATFTPDLAPGSFISIFGAGLGRSGSATRVSLGETSLNVVFATPFQVNATIPSDVQPGNYTLRVTSPYGTADTQVTIAPVAPQVFRFGLNRTPVVNQNALFNSPSAPARRGETVVLYGTGFGPVVAQGSLSVVQVPVVAIIGGREIIPAYAGLTPGFVGLYQVNVPLPLDLPPGLQNPMTFRQGRVESASWEIAIQ